MESGAPAYETQNILSYPIITFAHQGKGKAFPITCHESPEVEAEV
jgi:hypothetical protein